MKEIKLNGNYVALVDDEDYERVNQFKWRLAWNKGKITPYAIRHIYINGKRTTQRMHRFILNLPKERLTDHADMNGLNNQKYNLRECTNSQNNMNRVVQKNGTSIYKGVYFSKRMKKWVTQIRINNKQRVIGVFIDEIEAAQAYDRKAKELFGEFARVNFPENWCGERLILKVNGTSIPAVRATKINVWFDEVEY